LLTVSKTVAKTGPYTIHIPPIGWAAEFITKQVHSQRSLNRLPADGILEQGLGGLATGTYDSRELRSRPESSSQGSTYLVAIATDLDKTRLLSRHTSTQATRVYLAAGLFDISSGKEMHKMISALQDSKNNTYSFSRM
jgi:hypothetical protein